MVWKLVRPLRRAAPRRTATAVALVGTALLVQPLVLASAGSSGFVANGVAPAVEPHSPGDGLLFEEDFSRYGSIEAFLRAQPGGFYRSRGMNPEQMRLDRTVRLPNAVQSLRFDYPDRSESADRCANYSIGREIWFPRAEEEVWIEAWIRFSDTFSTIAPKSWRCSNNPDLKLLLGLVADGPGRFQVKVGKFGHYWATGYPGRQDQTLRVRSEPYFDGEWHQLRVHWRAANRLATSALWIDGRRVFRARRELTEASGIAGLRMGATLNQGPGREMSLWWGRIRVWRSAPEWYDRNGSDKRR